MKVFGEINAISKELLNQVPKLGPKDSAEYRLIGMRKDPENPGQWMIPFSTSVKSRTSIIDPHTNDIVDIAYIAQIKSRPTREGSVQEPDIKPIAFLRSQAGRIILQGGNPSDVLLHQYLYLNPQNAASPLRRENDEPAVYEYVDVRANAKKGIARMNRKLEAMGFINKLTVQDGLLDYAFIVSRAETTDPDVARYQLAEFAEADADRFFELVDSVDSQIKVVYLRAVKQGILAYDAQTGTIRWAKNQEVITAIPKAVKNREEAFVVWAKSAASNMKLVDTISAMVNNRPAIVTDPATIAVEVEEEKPELTEDDIPKPRRGRQKKDQL